MDTHKVLVFGMYSGEISHAYAVVKYLLANNQRANLVIGSKPNTIFFGKDSFAYDIAENSEEFKKIVAKVNPEYIILCNSKSYKHEENFIHATNSPFPKVKIFCLDSNWLFDNESKRYPYITWADKYFVTFPEKVFNLGLKKNGGYFTISQTMTDKIHPIGFIPSYKKPSQEQNILTRKSIGLSENDKVIFCYFSGFGAQGRPWVFENLKSALKIINNPQIKVIFTGNKDLIKSSYDKSFILLEINNLTKFYNFLACSDLIFQHQGLATLAQGIAAQIPIISNVAVYPKTEFAKLHPAEVKPFEKLGLCKMFYKTTPINNIAKAINQLLFDDSYISKMQQKQKNLYSSGEANLLNAILQS